MSSINCSGKLILALSKRFSLDLKLPWFVYPKYATQVDLERYLKKCGLHVLSSGSNTLSFDFHELKDNNAELILCYEGINKDNSKHVCIVDDMNDSNDIKLPHIDRYIKQEEFSKRLLMIVSKEDISELVDVHFMPVPGGA